MSASSRPGQIQVNTFFCLRILSLFILALHNQYILLLSKKKNKGKHRMLLSVLKFKSPCVLGSTPSDLQDRGIPLPQTCKEVRRHGFPTPLLPSSRNYCPKHKTHDLLVSKKALEDSRAGGRRIFRPDATTSVAPTWQCYLPLSHQHCWKNQPDSMICLQY